MPLLVVVLLFMTLVASAWTQRGSRPKTRDVKKTGQEEGTYEFQIHGLFFTDPLYINLRNRCVQLLDTIELPNDPPILVHPLLHPFYKPPLQRFEEFVTSFAKICEARLSYSYWGPNTSSLNKGARFVHENNVAHRSVHRCNPPSSLSLLIRPIFRDCTIRNIVLNPSNMYPGPFHPVRRVSISRSRDFHHKAKAYSWARRPTRYLLIDFGLSPPI
jgi:hypothetical protein